MSASNIDPILYIGSRTTDPNDTSKGVFAYRLSSKSDRIEFQHLTTLSGVINPSYIAITKSGQFLYALTESPSLEESRIHAWKLDDNAYIGSWPIGGVGACFLTIDKSDRLIYVASYLTGKIVAFKIINNEKGELIRCNTFTPEGGSNVVPGKQESSHITAITLSPNDDYVYASDSGNDCVWRIYFSCITGFQFMSELPRPCPAPKGSGPGKSVIAEKEDGLFLYVGCQLSNHLLTYWVDYDEFGMLEQCQYLPVVAHDEIKNQSIDQSIDGGVIDIQLSIDSQFLYVASSVKNTISVFGLEENGNVNFIQWIESGGAVPRSLILAPNLKLIFIANEESQDVTAFEIDAASGKILDKKGRVALPSPPLSLKLCFKND